MISPSPNSHLPSTAILAIRYLEPDWDQTQRCITAASAATGSNVTFVDRNPPGIGSLAEAINRGFKEALNPKSEIRNPKYIWVVTNVTFAPDLLSKLVTALENSDYAAIHPAFASDHLFCQPNSSLVTRHSSALSSVPFCEFTAPLIRSDVLANYPLDEALPYWGHDLDWGYRLWQDGHKIGVYDDGSGPLLGHTYVRFLDNGQSTPRVTRQRHALRRATNNATRHRLIQKYGNHYRQVVFPRSTEEIKTWMEKRSLSIATAC